MYTERPALMQAIVEQLATGEEILWEGAPCFQSYRFHKLFTNAIPTLIVAVIVWTICGFAMFTILSQPIYNQDGYAEIPKLVALIPFFLGLAFSTPIFIWIAEAVTIHSSCNDTYYVITNKRVIIQSAGISRREIKSSFMHELSGAFLKIDWMDKRYQTGTVRLMFKNLNFMHTQNTNHASRAAALNEIRHIDDAENVFAKTQKIITEAQTANIGGV
jgi:hypothetical protein